MAQPPPTWVTELLDEHRRSNDWHRQTARAVADLALGLAHAETQARARHSELLGILLARDAQKLTMGGEPERRERRDPSGVTVLESGAVEIAPRRVSEMAIKILKWAILAITTGGGWLLHALHQAQRHSGD